MKELDKFMKPYLKKKGKDIGYKKASPVHDLFNCPFCGARANTLPNQNKIQCLSSDKYLDFVDIVKKIEGLKNEKEVIEFLKNFLDIDLTTKKEQKHIDVVFDFLEKNKINALPVKNGGEIKAKEPIEKGWQKKEHKDKSEWHDWLDNGLNFGINTGKMSGITVIDVDVLSKKNKTNKEKIESKKIPHKLKKVLNETLIQETAGGYHFIYKYEQEIPKTAFDIDGIHVDIENDGGFILGFPSNIEGRPFKRHFKGLREISKMSKELKIFLKENIGNFKKKTYSETIISDVEKSNYKKPLISDGEGRNDLFIRMGGKLLKYLNPDLTKRVLKDWDNVICDPPLGYELNRTVFGSLEKYFQYDEDRIRNEMIDYLKDVEEASKAEIEFAILGNRSKGELKKKLDRLLSYMLQERIIVKRGNKYRLLKSMNWKDTFMDQGKKIDFKVPFFNDKCVFRWGDLIIVSGSPEIGKTTLAMNFIKRLVDQGIKPYYVYNEAGGRWKKYALNVGLKEVDFWSAYCSDPNELILEDGAITIYDWVKPPDFARTDNLYNMFAEQLDRTKGVLICFVQTRDDGSLFAKDQLKQFPTFVARYDYEDEIGETTKFKIFKNREAKRKNYVSEIPCRYDWDNCLVYTQEEWELKKGDNE